MIYQCCDENRKAAVLGHPTLNGIDYLEVLGFDAEPLGLQPQTILMIRCLKVAPAGLRPDNVIIAGGESITNITATFVTPAITPAGSSAWPAWMTATQGCSHARASLTRWPMRSSRCCSHRSCASELGGPDSSDSRRISPTSRCESASFTTCKRYSPPASDALRRRRVRHLPRFAALRSGPRQTSEPGSARESPMARSGLSSARSRRCLRSGAPQRRDSPR